MTEPHHIIIKELVPDVIFSIGHPINWDNESENIVPSWCKSRDDSPVGVPYDQCAIEKLFDSKSFYKAFVNPEYAKKYIEISMVYAIDINEETGLLIFAEIDGPIEFDMPEHPHPTKNPLWRIAHA